MEELKRLVKMAASEAKYKGWHQSNDRLIAAIDTVNSMIDKTICKGKVYHDK